MAIPTGFYTTFRCKTTGMAAATGLLMGYFAVIFVPPFWGPWVQYASLPIGLIIAVIINQISVHNYINGKMRGAFEYIYRESLIESKTISGADTITSLSVYNTILSRIFKDDPEGGFFAYLAAAQAANVGSEFNNEIAALKQAVELRPNDLIANYRLGRAFERIGSAQDAIKAYEASLNDPSIDTSELRNFLASQVARVKEHGPQQASPIPGIIYQLM